MKDSHQPIKIRDKVYRKVDIRFNINSVTDIDVADMFDMVDENKKEFVDFLKKCQANYKKKIDNCNKEIKELYAEFDQLEDEPLEASA